MIAIMYDGLELGTFSKDNHGVLRLVLHDHVKRSWLPYIFNIGFDCDMNGIIEAWKKERVFPKNRIGSRKMLRELGLTFYNVDKIAYATRCSVITDPYWLVYEPEDLYSTCSIRGKLKNGRYPYNSMNLSHEEQYIWRK